MIHEFAPAKLNLYLHITGRRADGYHNLDSLVAFATVGDEVRLEPADSFQLIIEGPYSSTLQSDNPANNLVSKAAQSLAELTDHPLNIKLTLIKNLPIASGIGGGSSDAAAALRALARHWNIPLDDPRLFAAAAKHGQDVPACLVIANNYLTATGTEPAPTLPKASIILVNPNKALPTPDVYKVFKDSGHPFSPGAQLTSPPSTLPHLIAELKNRTNDLYDPACYLMPEIKSIIAALETTTNCLLARMSGSGATCFALYPTAQAAQTAATALKSTHPHWWITPGALS